MFLSFGTPRIESLGAEGAGGAPPVDSRLGLWVCHRPWPGPMNTSTATEVPRLAMPEDGHGGARHNL